MTDVSMAEQRTRSNRSTSPVPRRQLGVLPANQRSYSRMSSKGMFGDDSPLMSPLPLYPRRRSVTFAGDGPREERPCYNPAYDSAPASPAGSRRPSPPPPSILKKTSTVVPPVEDGAALEELPAAATAAQPPRSNHRTSARSSPVPQRGRSASRQRLAARKQEAKLHRSFYDDSFVEEYVLSAKSEYELEEQQELEKMRAEKEASRRAEQREAEETSEKMRTLQRAKEVLLAAAAQRRNPSLTPSPTRRSRRSSRATMKADADAEADLIQSLEEDPDPLVQKALAELAKETAATSRKRPHTDRRSMPIVYEASESEEDEDGSDRRKRAKLESIVSSILAQRRGKSKKSVVVINWSDAESEGGMADGNDSDEDYDEETPRAPAPPVRRRAATKSRSLAVPVVETSNARKAPSSRRQQPSRSNRVNSVAPDLGDSFLLEEEEQPILLPRRKAQRPAPTRSISQLNAEVDDLLLSEESKSVARKPPRTNRPRAKKATTTAQQQAGNNSFTSSRSDPYAAMQQQSVTAAPPPQTRARRQPRAAASAAPTAVSSDDPMAVFFDAAFPSPSKFDHMMMQAGGLPEARRGGRGQPNLVLPSSISRRR